MKKYLYFVTKPYSIPIIKPIFETVEKFQKGENLIFAFDYILQWMPEKMKKFSTDSLQEVIDYKPDIVFVPGNVIHDKIPGVKVQIFHGLCEEKKGHYKITGFFDIYCTSGPLITRKFKKLEEKYGHFIVVETGWPKVDYILGYDEGETGYPVANISKGKKIILYAPTFSPRFKSTHKLLPYLKDILRDDEVLIVKFHDLADKKEVELYKKLNNIIVYDSPDNVPLLHMADILISDTSSIVYEFMLLDKPVITIDARVRKEKALNIVDPLELRSAIDRAFKFPQEHSSKRREVLQLIHPYRDKLCSLRVLDAVDKIIESGALESLKRKPLNLIRAYKVRKMFRYW
ncbi:MAG: hypothetical protein DRP92_01495 [Candidatus Neomarinimicrobiota bacterium]|nr:CDP-glycerol glycerophosphotransferase family protein [Candidatus Neomarinimicrobiota bacterium]RKY54284.1 MAG: hypothetical protein DRP92_01495 [Candidatus Neomarinimicrobiota bacterium]